MNKVLVVGSGGREHALGWKLAQSPKVKKIYFAPGNAGTAQIGENIDIGVLEFEKIAEFVLKKKIDLVVVGPEEPLAKGIVDFLEEKKIKVFGPKKEAAKIEASKAFAKKLMKEENIPTAKWESFKDFSLAKKYLLKQSLPIVIKASGLALGKGVIIAKTKAQALRILEDIMIKKIFGDAGKEVVIEEYLIGKEVSIHAFCDGKAALLFPSSRDHKKTFDGDKGPNTGGMGTIAPLPDVNEELMKQIKNEIVLPVLKALKKKRRGFKGLLYPGIMLTKEGPKVLEFNARFGDPETQTYMRLLKADLLEILLACIEGKLEKFKIEWDKKTACCIVLASGGYPEAYEKGKVIRGIKDAEKLKDVIVFHAGTKLDGEKVLTNGGRVLGVTATGKNLKKALDLAYKAIKKINFEGMQYRKDIGKRPPLVIK